MLPVCPCFSAPLPINEGGSSSVSQKAHETDNGPGPRKTITVKYGCNWVPAYFLILFGGRKKKIKKTGRGPIVTLLTVILIAITNDVPPNKKTISID